MTNNQEVNEGEVGWGVRFGVAGVFLLLFVLACVWALKPPPAQQEQAKANATTTTEPPATALVMSNPQDANCLIRSHIMVESDGGSLWHVVQTEGGWPLSEVPAKLDLARQLTRSHGVDPDHLMLKDEVWLQNFCPPD